MLPDPGIPVDLSQFIIADDEAEADQYEKTPRSKIKGRQEKGDDHEPDGQTGEKAVLLEAPYEKGTGGGYRKENAPHQCRGDGNAVNLHLSPLAPGCYPD